MHIMPVSQASPSGQAESGPAVADAGTAASAAAPRVRKDVARNRAHLLATADKLIAQRGLDVSFHELAAAAGTGVGTVYRHFPSRDDLLGALIEERFAAAREILLAADRAADPVRALREAVTGLCEMHQADRGTLQVMVSGTERLRQIARQELVPIIERIIARAKASGRVRPDFGPTDLPMIFTLIGALGPGTRPGLWRRYVDALLDGFMTDAADRAGPGIDPPTEAEIEQSIAAGTVR
jgi:AcrR family transcriptional regulator